MSVEDETWDRPTCPHCGRKIPYGEKGFHGERLCYCPEEVLDLQPHEVFVFGSNYAGRHGKGAAKIAEHWGARRGQGMGIMGQTYGIATKDHDLKVLPLGRITVQIERFIRFARVHPELHFLVTPIGCGLARFTPRQVAPQFGPVHLIPKNVALPLSFWEVLTKHATPSQQSHHASKQAGRQR